MGLTPHFFGSCLIIDTPSELPVERRCFTSDWRRKGEREGGEQGRRGGKEKERGEGSGRKRGERGGGGGERGRGRRRGERGEGEGERDQEG